MNSVFLVFIEEAAEILEPHIVASLTPSVQHLILIGDHQQLRPTSSVYKLAQLYKMDISLFERMINNNINCATLTEQYRMRPEIANLIRPTIYRTLIDSASVQRYPVVTGTEKSMFFLTHTHPESTVCHSSTYSVPLIDNSFDLIFVDISLPGRRRNNEEKRLRGEISHRPLQIPPVAGLHRRRHHHTDHIQWPNVSITKRTEAVSASTQSACNRCRQFPG